MRLIGALLILICGLATPVMAQDAPAAPDTTPMLMLRQMTQSHPEHVLLAYYRLAGIKPDFSQWSALSPFLDNASNADVPTIVNREVNRLENAYGHYDAADVLSVHTRLNISDYSTLREVLTVPEFNAQTFFTYSLYGEHVAIVPKDMAAFHEIALTRERMDEILGLNRTSQITAELILKPVHADTATPFMHNNKPYKLMLADIAEIRFWTTDRTDPKLLWTYRADWYTPKSNQSLMNLKAGGAQQD